ncbi:MAG: efflux RND transporter periplasmic adaptor subunit [Gemmatimonadetes bacterium]|nr:efflux RND transporter periplasmic adaptor subunit [Gemmatimonadota bacterium]
MARAKWILFPVGGLAVAALAVFLLDRAEVIDLDFGGDGKALAAEDGDKKKGKKGDDEEEEIVPVPVELALAEGRQIAAFYRASSFVEPDRQVNLVAKTTGRVHKVSFEEGDWVKKGQVLAELENDRERIRFRQEELRAAERERERDRSRSLLERKLITQEDFDAKESALELARAERDLAGVALEETYLRAPFDGQVTERLIVPGQHVNPSEPLFTLVDFEPLRVRINLPESIARKVSDGDEVHLIAEAQEAPVPAIVERVAPVVDPTTSTVRVTLLVSGQPEALRVGGFVKVRITTDTHTDALSVPKLALVEEGGLRSVFVAEADSVRKVEVRTGLYDESHVEILDGVSEGAMVVSLGQGGLRTGSRIEVLNAAMVGWVAPEPAESEDGDESGDDDETEIAQTDDDRDE